MKTPTPSSSSTSSTFTSSLTPQQKKPFSQPPTSPFKTAFSPKLKVPTNFAANGRTKQSFKAECDINVIMERYQKTGVLDFAQKHEAQYGDCTGLDFTAAMQVVVDARNMFNDLPSSVRARFGNDPAQLLDFVQHPENREEAIKLGLVQPMTAQAPLPPEPSKPAAGAPGEAPKGPKLGSDGKPIPPQTNSPT